MMTDPTSATGLVDAYLARLDTAAADLPPASRAELRDQIETHLAETAPPGAAPGEIRRALDELGTPEEIAAAARVETGTTAPPTAPPPPAPPAPPGRDRSGAVVYDVSTVVLLIAGGFVVPVLGWLAGAVMLWAGPRWTTTEKVLGTVVWPLAALATLAVFRGIVPVESTLAILGLALGLLVVLAAFGTVFVTLLRAAGRRRTSDVA